MNWTHRIKLPTWSKWYLIDIENPDVCCPEDNKERIIGLTEGWWERVRVNPHLNKEELNFSLENE